MLLIDLFVCAVLRLMCTDFNIGAYSRLSSRINTFRE